MCPSRSDTILLDGVKTKTEPSMRRITSILFLEAHYVEELAEP